MSCACVPRARSQDVDGKPPTVIPGMMAEVDVLTGQRTILDYFLKPVVKVREKAFRE